MCISPFEKETTAFCNSIWIRTGIKIGMSPSTLCIWKPIIPLSREHDVVFFVSNSFSVTCFLPGLYGTMTNILDSSLLVFTLIFFLKEIIPAFPMPRVLPQVSFTFSFNFLSQLFCHSPSGAQMFTLPTSQNHYSYLTNISLSLITCCFFCSY